MAKNTGIDWTDHTWNPWQGCRKVSPGCLNCYMFREKRRYRQDPVNVIRSKPPTFNSPLKWKDPAKVFVCSWSDFFIEEADEWREDAWDIIRKSPHLTFQILTKRPENIKDRLPDDWPLPNVWLGVTAENQEMADKRLPILLSIPASIHFVSVEPMVGPVDLYRYMPPGVNLWVICGGESGPNARTIEHSWILNLRIQCHRAKVPFFMKQMSGGEPIPTHLKGREFPK